MRRAAPKTFRSQAAFRAWLKRHHRTARELIVRIYKTSDHHRGLTYTQAVDEALCFGWIDGVRRALDGQSFSTRFSPRKPRSIWSRINVRHAQRLIQTGRMTRAGLAAFQAREASRTGIYSFEQRPTRLSPALGRKLRANAGAWAYFRTQPPWYRRTSSFWVMSAKQETTRARRLSILMTCSARRMPIPPLRRPEGS